MRVTCEVHEIELDGDYAAVPSVCIICTRCDHESESYGTSEASVRRSLAELRETCPYAERNFYVTDESWS